MLFADNRKSVLPKLAASEKSQVIYSTEDCVLRNIVQYCQFVETVMMMMMMMMNELIFIVSYSLNRENSTSKTLYIENYMLKKRIFNCH